MIVLLKHKLAVYYHTIKADKLESTIHNTLHKSAQMSVDMVAYTDPANVIYAIGFGKNLGDYHHPISLGNNCHPNLLVTSWDNLS